MIVVRPIEKKDQKAFETLAYTMTLGVTSLPKDPKLLAEKIDRSLEAFSIKNAKPHHHLYIFVSEDLESKDLIGTSAIRAKTAHKQPAYFYQIEEVKHNTTLPGVINSYQILRPIKYENGPSELCGLFLHPDKRKANLGKLLSYSRFLMIANHPKRFSKTLIAEMRGYIDENGQSPFWDHVGRHFYNVSFEQALEVAIYHKEKLNEIMPEHPILVPFLPKHVQNILSKTHKHTAPAIKMLLDEGFYLTNEIDLFDAGPKIEAPINEIRTIRESRLGKIKEIGPIMSEKNFLISTTGLNFRACIAPLNVDLHGNLLISKEIADTLQVKRGDQLRFIEE